jgi:hypothetical protein
MARNAHKPSAPLLRVRISDTIYNEYQTRAVFEPVRAKAEAAAPKHEIAIDRATASALLSDAEFNGDGRQGPSEMPLAYGNAYRALAKQLRGLLAPQGGK